MSLSTGQISRLLQQPPSQLVLLGAGAAFIIGLAYLLQGGQDLFPHIPSVGKKGWESTRRKEFMANAQKLYAEGYRKVSHDISMQWEVLLSNSSSTRMESSTLQRLGVCDQP